MDDEPILHQLPWISDDELYQIQRAAKFWQLVERTRSCWLWRGFVDAHGYGQFERNTKAHRFAFETVFGKIPNGLVVCHKCDVPRCVNPEHLFVGTNLDNSLDMAAKGRSARAKFTPDQVSFIRHENQRGVSQRELARIHQVHPQTIHRIVHSQTWQRLEGR